MDISFNPNLSTSGNDFDDLQNPQSLARRLETSEARIYGLLATLPQIVWLAQVNGSVTNFNPRWYEYTGLTASESLGWGFLKAIHPEDRDSLRQSYAASAVVGEPMASHREEATRLNAAFVAQMGLPLVYRATNASQGYTGSGFRMGGYLYAQRSASLPD
jgi:PAS domain S-box-containing protein